MRAVITSKSGPPEVLQIKDIPKPVPRDDEILVKIHAGTVTRGDVILRGMHPLLWIPMRFFGVRKKQILGTELAGVVEKAGAAAKLFKAGDQVYGTTTALSAGAYAEYICLPDDGLQAIKPGNLSFEEAAALSIGGMTALQILQSGGIRRGQKVLVYGASGSVGTYAVQLAVHFGAEVTGVCGTANLEMVKTLGAAEVIDYTREDFAAGGQVYDLIFDAVGKASQADVKKALKPDGRSVSIRASTSEKTEYLGFLRKLVEAGELKAVIDRVYPLDQIVAAHRYVETGRKKGNVVIEIQPGSPA